MKITKRLGVILLAVILFVAVPSELQAATVTTTEQESIVSVQEEMNTGVDSATMIEDNLKYATTSSAFRASFPTELKVHTGVSSKNHS